MTTAYRASADAAPVPRWCVRLTSDLDAADARAGALAKGLSTARYIEPATQRTRARAPRKTVPVARQIDASILDRFIASNSAVRDVIGRARGHDVNRVRFRNPFVPVIRFTVGTGLQVIVRHNHRHLLQAERVIELSDFPGG